MTLVQPTNCVLRLAFLVALSLALVVSRASLAEAEAPRDTSCDALVTDAWTTVTSAEAGFAHAKVGYFNKMFRLLNTAFPAGVEAIFCHLQKSLGITTSVSSLPVSATRTWDGLTVSLGLSTPSDSFSAALGYDVSAQMSYNSINVMNFYWGGAGSATKGFLVEGRGNFAGGNRPMYVQWDRSGSAQTLKVLGTEFQNSFLANASATSEARGDRTAYGTLTYNASTAAFTIQVVAIEEQHAGGTAGQFGCFKMAASGTKNGSIQIAYTQSALSGPGHALSSSAKDSTEMEGLLITDSTSTASGCESSPTSACRPLTGGELSSLAVFDKSCQDLSQAGTAPGAFGGSSNNATLSASPSEVF